MDKELKARIRRNELSLSQRINIIRNLDKLEKIEQIVANWNNDASHSFSDMCKINGILKE